MKRILALIALLAMSIPAFAQNRQVTDNGLQLNHVQLATQYGNSVAYFPIRPGMTTHQFTFFTQPAISAITVTVAMSTNGSSYTLCGAASSDLGGTISCTGAYTRGRVTITNYAGSGAVDADYYGVSTAQGSGGGGSSSVQITDGTDTAAVTAGGDLQVACSNCTGSGASKVDDAAFGIATDSVAPAGFLFDDVATDSVGEGDVGLGRMSGNRVQYQILRDAAGNERGANVTAANELQTIVSAITAGLPGGTNNIGDVDVASIAAGDNNIGNVDLASAIPAGTNNIGDVDILTIAAGDNNIGNMDVASIAAGDNNIGNVDLASAIPAGTNNIGDVDAIIANGADTAQGSTTDAKCLTTDTTACTLIGLAKAISANTEAIAGAVMPLSTGCAITSAASTNSTSCKGSSGNRTGWWVVNTTATLYYLRLYNTAAAPTCSSATGFVISIPIPASTTGAGIAFSVPNTVAFATGLGYCLTGGASSTDNTNAATGVFGELFYN